MKKVIILLLAIILFLFKINNVLAEEFITTETDNKVMYIKSENGSFSYSWSFDEDLKDSINFDLEISFDSPFKQKIDLLDGAKKEYVSFNYHGALPGTATIKVPITKFNDNDRLKLYYYNDKTNEIELISDNVIVKNGYATIEINHCSDYFFKASVVRDVDSKNTGGIIIVAMIVIIVALMGYTLFKKY